MLAEDLVIPAGDVGMISTSDISGLRGRIVDFASKARPVICAVEYRKQSERCMHIWGCMEAIRMQPTSLADHGPNSRENVAAVCPICHRRGTTYRTELRSLPHTMHRLA